ncbi:EexN family lipoprotein (plasmid) [Brevundimonas staleyi]|uniref:EexN family lipoprotein n=1 Tax=Brevundimonas staleyi TaxID=74326 RepID=A0ABW0FMY5_9CAUL
MRLRHALLTAPLVAAAGLGACQPAEPRSAGYFIEHREEAARVLADCATGAHRGAECVAAQAARVETDREARIQSYRRQRQAP